MMTDEQMKELVRFSRIEVPIDGYRSPLYMDDYRKLFCTYSRTLLVQIIYNVNKTLDNCYDTQKYAKAARLRAEALEMIKHLQRPNVDFTEINIPFDHAEEIQLEAIKSDPTCSQPVYYACIVSYILVRLNTYFDGADDTFISDMAATAAIYSHRVQKDTYKIIIKTILDYYNEDYQTFEALYL